MASKDVFTLHSFWSHFRDLVFSTSFISESLSSSGRGGGGH